MSCYVAGNLLSLALDAIPQCVGQLLTADLNRTDKVAHIIETLTMNGAVLIPYPCYHDM